MFHRVPFISPASVVTAAVILALAALFALSLSSPGTAHADHPDLPEVSITSITPEIGEEGGRLRVTLQLSRPLTADEKYCYRRGVSDGNNGEVCIQGGILVWDNYDDHLKAENAGDVDNLTAFVFRGGETQQRKTVDIADDQCITPDREIRVAINWAFDNSDDYGYTIASDSGKESQRTVRVHGNDVTNGGVFGVDLGGKCKAINDGDDEEVIANRAPAFGKNPLTRSVDENTAPDENIGSPVTADDEEDDDLTYSLTGADADHFHIDSSTGQILTYGDLNYETKSTYHLAVSVTDGYDIYGDPDSAEDDSIGVTISVNDVNEAPVFADDAPTALNVIENTAAGVDIGDPVTATDPEGKTVTYELDDGDGAAFEIDDTTGQIKTKASLMDEAQDTYTVTVTASDDDGNEAEHVVTITVIDANDPPEFSDEIPQGETGITRSVAENTAASEPVGDPVAATDEESDTLTYSLAGTDAASFDIDTTSGQIKTKDPLDFEGGTTRYSVTVSVHDGKDISGNTEDPPNTDATIDVTIEVTDVNEGPAFDANAPATQEVAENTAAETNIGSPYTATDPENDTPLTYSLGGTDAASFAIDATGQIKTKDALNYENAKNTYSVTLQVTDGKDAEGNTESPATIDDTHAVTITVTDADDPGSITFSSDPPIAGTTLTAVLEDQDGVKSDVAVTWKWEISIDQTNWTPITDATTNSYTPGTDDIGDYLRVTATYDDEKGPGKKVEVETDAVLTAPASNTDASFADLDATRSVPENTAAGQPIGAPVAAVDPDNEDTLTYSLGGTDAASFDIDTSNGQLKTKDALDFDAGQTTYSVDVSVSDSKDKYDTADTLVDATIAVTINVTDVNEKPVFADDAPTTQTVAENTAADSNISSAYTATDDDGDTLTYTLDSGSAATFDIDANGQLKTKADLDYEDDSRYTVIVQVSDSKDDNGAAEGTPTVDDTHTVTITVTDQDDDGTITFSSDTPAAGTTLTATLEDDDGVKATPVVAWLWESSTDQNNWTTVNGADTDSLTLGTGDVGNYYRVTATYDDELAGGKTAVGETANAVVTAPPTNQNPEFADATTTREVAENTPAGQNIGAPITATHANGKGTLVYSLDTTGADTFDIDSSTGQLKTKADLDYESGSATYHVTISVSDSLDDYSHADTVEDSSIDVTITVTDVNEPPQFADDAVTALEVSEETTIGVGIGEYEAFDPDPSDTVTYSVSGTDAALFQVDSFGQLQVKEALDYEDGDTLTVVVSATDSRDDSGTTEQKPLPDDTLTVTVTVTITYLRPPGSTRTIPDGRIKHYPLRPGKYRCRPGHRASGVCY